VNQSPQWDRDALWDLAGRATIAAAWRVPGLETASGPSYWYESTSPNLWAANLLALYGRPNDADGMLESLQHVIDHGLEAGAFVHARTFPQLLPWIESKPILRGGLIPMMARSGPSPPALRRPYGGSAERLAPGSDPAAALAIVAGAFDMDPAMVQQDLGGAIEHPEIAFHGARVDALTAVCISHIHDDTCYIDIMAAAKSSQRQGSGRAVLCTAMDDAAQNGVDHYFLFASEAGQPLYQSLGYDVIDVGQFWMINWPPEDEATTA
jgi:hypothetical protein